MMDPLMSGAGPEIKCLPKIKNHRRTQERARTTIPGTIFLYQRFVCLVFKSSEFYLIELSCLFAVVFFSLITSSNS